MPNLTTRVRELGSAVRDVSYALTSRIRPRAKQWYPLAITGGAVNSSWGLNWWQRGYTPANGGTVATAEACVDAYAQTIASLKVAVYDYAPQGHKTKNTSVAASRLLQRPNSYQTKSDFEFNKLKALLYYGNSYAVGIRNERNEFIEWHLLDPRSTTPYVDPETKAVFYGLGNNELYPGDITALVPQRDMLHIRLYTPRHPLIGVSPIEAVAASMVANGSVSASQAAFFNNMRRPSGIISVTETLKKAQMTELRDAWDEQSKDIDSGGVPILGSGAKWEPMSITSQDAQLVEAFNMTVMDIARGFRVPLPLVNLYENASYNNVEQLYSQWLAGGLGFLVSHIEQSYEKFFVMPLNRGIDYDVDSLLRADFEKRVEGYSKLTQAGIYPIDQARAKFDGSPPVPFGDQPLVQQQMVGLEYAHSQTVEDPPADPAPEQDPPTDAPAELAISTAVTRAKVINMIDDKFKGL